MARALYFLLALLVFTLIVTFALLTRSCSAPVIPVCFDRRVTMDEAATRSGDSGKPVLVFVTADWCDDCRELRTGAFNKSRVTDWVRANTEPVYLDVSKAATGDTEAQALMARLGVEEPPAIILLRKGHEIGRVTGVPKASELLEKLEKMTR